jgi:hypothetical protein
MLFSVVSQVLLLLFVLPGHLSQHAKAATAEGLTFSDPIHKKSARKLNMYDFCHSPKKLAAVLYNFIEFANDTRISESPISGSFSSPNWISRCR